MNVIKYVEDPRCFQYDIRVQSITIRRILLLLAVLIPAICGGQSFDAVVNFDSDLESISNPTVFQTILKDGRTLILEGLVGDSIVKEIGGESQVWVNLVGGTWVGTEAIRTYSCRVIFRGEQWKNVFTSSRSKASEASLIPSGVRLLVAVQPLLYSFKESIPVVEMLEYRILQ